MEAQTGHRNVTNLTESGLLAKFQAISLYLLTLLHSARPKLHRVLAVLSAKGLKCKDFPKPPFC